MSSDRRHRAFLTAKRAIGNVTPLTNTPSSTAVEGWVPYPNDYAPSPAACALMKARWRGIRAAWLIEQKRNHDPATSERARTR